MQYDGKEYIDILHCYIMEKTYILRFALYLTSVLLFMSGLVMIGFYDIIIGSIFTGIILLIFIPAFVVFYALYNKTTLTARKKVRNYNIALEDGKLKTCVIFADGTSVQSYDITQISKITKYKGFVEIICDDNRRIVVKNDTEFWENIGNILAENCATVKNRE